MGPYERCKVPINASCFSTKASKLLLCGDMSTKGEIRATVGLFSCGSISAKKPECEIIGVLKYAIHAPVQSVNHYLIK